MRTLTFHRKEDGEFTNKTKRKEIGQYLGDAGERGKAIRVGAINGDIEYILGDRNIARRAMVFREIKGKN